MTHIITIMFILSITALYAKIQTQPSVKPNVAPEKKNKCCSIQRTFKNKINITEICIENNITKIELTGNYPLYDVLECFRYWTD
ncbi:MAG: hypothetical protein IPQ05_23560 [Leptospiraceae bacterium]|nr:hypothetical protein [Leptospiraceae bacterium]